MTVASVSTKNLHMRKNGDVIYPSWKKEKTNVVSKGFKNITI